MPRDVLLPGRQHEVASWGGRASDVRADHEGQRMSVRRLARAEDRDLALGQGIPHSGRRPRATTSPGPPDPPAPRRDDPRSVATSEGDERTQPERSGRTGASDRMDCLPMRDRSRSSPRELNLEAHDPAAFRDQRAPDVRGSGSTQTERLDLPGWVGDHERELHLGARSTHRKGGASSPRGNRRTCQLDLPLAPEQSRESCGRHSSEVRSPAVDSCERTWVEAQDDRAPEPGPNARNVSVAAQDGIGLDAWSKPPVAVERGSIQGAEDALESLAP